MAIINGTNGNDDLVGTEFDDTINALKRIAPGYDTVDGKAGVDTLIVNAAAETDSVQLISGSSPTFQVRSSSGNFYVDAYNMERVQFTGGSANDTINTGNHGGSVNGGAGTDSWTADLSAVATAITFTVGTAASIAAADLTSIKAIEQINLTTGAGNDTINGGFLADHIDTGAGDDKINAGTVISGGPGDIVDGGIGTDTLIVNAAAETDSVQLIAGSSPTFQVRSSSGNFYVDAYNMERVQFTAGSANDTINTGNHGGSVDGGAGIDSWTADLSAVITNITFILGTTPSIAAAGLTSIKNIEQLNLTTGTGNDTISGGVLADHISTGAGDDTINAGTVISGGPGDVVDGGTGIDTLIVNAAAETDSVQLISGSSPTFQVRSGSGNFYVDAYSIENVKFTGGSANDTINTGNHGGTVNGGAGSDSWTANLGAVSSNIAFTLGTTSNILAAGLTSILNIEQINLTTGNGNDTIIGGALADSITSGAGNDTINAGARVAGANGADYVDGGVGIDTLVVNAGAETHAVQLISGSSPTFQVRSGSGNFYVDAYNMEKVQFVAGTADDTIDTGNHGGSVDGGAGNDFWIANLGAVTSAIAFTLGTTTAIAGAGLTSILGIEQIDLTTGIGSDTINGGIFADHIVTGAGNDTINAGTRVVGGSGIDFVDGGAGIDTLVVNAGSETHAVQLVSGSSPTFQVRSSSGNFYVDAYSMEKVQFTAGSADDTINTGDHGGTVDGGAGNDFWIANLGAVKTAIAFTLGTTTEIVAAGLTSIVNLERIDLTTGAGSDTISGGVFADHIVTGGGNDTIDARTVLPGGPGDVVDGGAGIDTLVVNAGAETQGVQLGSGSSPTFQVRSNSGNFYVDAYSMEKVRFTGGSSNDAINTGNHGGTVDGGAGSDFWAADLGAVTSNIAFTLGSTTQIAAAGLTSILGIERIDLTTGSGNDTLVGGVLADHFVGGAGDDTINAGTRVAGANGIDLVDGGAGIDTLIVNAGSETQGVQLGSGASPTFQLRSNSGNFYVDAYSMEKVRFTGGSGSDAINTGNHGGTVDGGAGSDFWAADLSGVTSDIAFTLGTTTSIAAAELTSILRIERIDLTTGSGNDTLVGGALADRIVSGAGDDTINAGTRVAGSNGVDVVDGGIGTDTLIVNAGSETQGMQFISGASPTFQLRSNSGNFSIDAYSMEKAQVTSGSGNDSLAGGSGDDLLVAGAGNDALQGNSGQDTLTGGTGADQFIYRSGDSGLDTITDFSGQTAFGGGAGQGDHLTLDDLLVGTFAYRGGLAFTGTGNTEARVTGGHVLIDTDGNGASNIDIMLTGLSNANQLVAGDFLFT